MRLFDTHCHIHEATFELKTEGETLKLWQKAGKPNPDVLISEATEAGVVGMVCVGTTAADSALAVRFVKDRPTCWASIGIHPHEAKTGKQVLSQLAKLAKNPKADKVVAVGECGLDYFYGHSPKSDQIAALRFQIELALRHDLPLIFHVRDAFDDFWPIFDSYRGVRGVVHSFTDTQANLDKILARGLYVGLNGIITFTKNDWQLAVAKNIPIQSLLCETDAPFLTPAPLRGRVNAPVNVSLVAEFLAKLRGESLSDFAKATTQNAFKLFNV